MTSNQVDMPPRETLLDSLIWSVRLVLTPWRPVNELRRVWHDNPIARRVFRRWRWWVLVLAVSQAILYQWVGTRIGMAMATGGPVPNMMLTWRLFSYLGHIAYWIIPLIMVLAIGGRAYISYWLRNPEVRSLPLGKTELVEGFVLPCVAGLTIYFVILLLAPPIHVLIVSRGDISFAMSLLPNRSLEALTTTLVWATIQLLVLRLHAAFTWWRLVRFCLYTVGVILVWKWWTSLTLMVASRIFGLPRLIFRIELAESRAAPIFVTVTIILLFVVPILRWLYMRQYHAAVRELFVEEEA